MAWKPNYTTTSDLADFVRIGDNLDDVPLSLAVAAASRAVDRACGRQFGLLAAAAPRYYTARWDARRCRWVVAIDDLMSTTNLVVAFDSDADETYSSTVTDYVLGPRNAAADGVPWRELTVRAADTTVLDNCADAVRITALWGWTTVPDPIVQATLLQASRLLSRRDSPHGIAGSPEAGSEIRLLERLDPDVAIAVRPFRRAWGAV